MFFFMEGMYLPIYAISRLYRKLFNLKTKLVKDDMKAAFDTLAAMRPEKIR